MGEMVHTTNANSVYTADETGQLRRQYSHAEVLEALRAILPSSESHVESLTYCWTMEINGIAADPELVAIAQEWQARLRRAYEVAEVEPPEWSVLKRGHQGPDCPCENESRPPGAAAGESA